MVRAHQVSNFSLKILDLEQGGSLAHGFETSSDVFRLEKPLRVGSNGRDSAALPAETH